MHIWSRNLLLQSSNIPPVPENFIKYSNGNTIIYKNSETNKIYDQNLNLLNPQPAYEDIYSSYIINNASIVGTLTSSGLGKYTGFSTSNYIKPYMSLAYNCGSNPWKVQIKFNLNTIDKTNFLWGGNAGTYLPDIYVTWENKFKIRLSSNGSSYDITDSATGTFTIQANTDYWARLEYTGSKYSLSYSTDGETFTEDISVTSSTHIENTSDISVIGVRGDLGDPIDGYIDLSDSYYELNGTKYNFGYKQLNEGLNIKEPSFTLQNATVSGTLTNNNGVYSGFSQYNYLYLNKQISLANDFEFYTRVKMPDISTITGTQPWECYQCIFGQDMYFFIDVYGDYNKKFLYLKSSTGNGSSWLNWETSHNFKYIPNQVYDIKLIKSNNIISLYTKSIYETEYKLDWSYTNTSTSSFSPNIGSYGTDIALHNGSYVDMSATKLIYNGIDTTFNSAASITIPQGMYEKDSDEPVDSDESDEPHVNILRTVYSTKASTGFNSAYGSKITLLSVTPDSSKTLTAYFRLTGTNLSNTRVSDILVKDSQSSIAIGFNNTSAGSVGGSIFLWDNYSSSVTDSYYAFHSTQWLKLVINSSSCTVYGSDLSTYDYNNISSWTQIATRSYTGRLTSGKDIEITCNSTTNSVYQQIIIKHDNDTVFDLQTATPSQYTLGDGTLIGEYEIPDYTEHYTFDSNGRLVDCDNTVYIESTGTQYINTGIVPKSSTVFNIKEAQSETGTASRSGWGSTGSQEAFWWATQLTSRVISYALYRTVGLTLRWERIL